MSLWWLQPGWTEIRCACGAVIWPAGDPDWGACVQCFEASWAEQRQAQDDAECERIMALSEEEIDAELRAEGLDPAAVATEMRATTERAIKEAEARKAERK
jgi:hypothetical protein